MDAKSTTTLALLIVPGVACKRQKPSVVLAARAAPEHR
jgi:hypothetical protein